MKCICIAICVIVPTCFDLDVGKDNGGQTKKDREVSFFKWAVVLVDMNCFHLHLPTYNYIYHYSSGI